MRVAGRGRIIIWEGGSLWIMQVVPARGSTSNSTDFHSHHAIQITLALEGRFELRSRRKAIPGGAAAVAPDVEHIFQSEGLVALLFVEPESEAGRAIAASLFARDDLVAVSQSRLADLTAELLAQYRRARIDEAALEKLGRQMILRLAGVAPAAPPDPRIRKIMAYAAARLDETISLGAAAKSAGLSPGRARHLFVEQSGLPFRQYLLWLRLTRAVAIFARRRSLTEAAHEAGFSDSAHFSRTFRRMFGIAAAMLEIL
ncbi:MAG TPA: AraC family transcriptional regulator [Rhizomicrobium sp.]|nr:AraC family transcriptional regulator [Rhizomicrobium sp.]